MDKKLIAQVLRRWDAHEQMVTIAVFVERFMVAKLTGVLSESPYHNGRYLVRAGQDVVRFRLGDVTHLDDTGRLFIQFLLKHDPHEDQSGEVDTDILYGTTGE